MIRMEVGLGLPWFQSVYLELDGGLKVSVHMKRQPSYSHSGTAGGHRNRLCQGGKKLAVLPVLPGPTGKISRKQFCPLILLLLAVRLRGMESRMDTLIGTTDLTDVSKWDTDHC